MKTAVKLINGLLLAAILASISGCEDPQVYGSIGVSSGYSRYGGGWGGSGVHTSISVGGRIR